MNEEKQPKLPIAGPMPGYQGRPDSKPPEWMPEGSIEHPYQRGYWKVPGNPGYLPEAVLRQAIERELGVIEREPGRPDWLPAGWEPHPQRPGYYYQSEGKAGNVYTSEEARREIYFDRIEKLEQELGVHVDEGGEMSFHSFFDTPIPEVRLAEINASPHGATPAEVRALVREVREARERRAQISTALGSISEALGGSLSQ